MIKKLFPKGKAKAFNISYDDGVLQDVRFVELLNKYGLKGTFNLNAGLMKERFTWYQENGTPVTRLSESEAVRLYDGHEVASHTWSHPYLDSMARTEVLRELYADKCALEQLFDREVTGFAVPFLFYSDEIAACVRQAGFAYARISEESGNYAIPEDLYFWRGSIFHWSEDLESFVHGFLQTDQELAFCQIVGHSYDLDAGNMWQRMELIFRQVAQDPDVLAVTNGEIAEYIRAMRCAHISDNRIENHTDFDLWFNINGQVTMVPAGGVLNIQ